jgi:hypothetical protein
MLTLMRSVSDSVSSRGVLADDLAQGGPGDLVDGRTDVFDGHHRPDRVDDAEVDDGGHVDADVVAGDDALGLDGHGDDAQAHPVQDVHERDDDGQAGLADADDAAEPEEHSLLVLFDDPDGEREHQQLVVYGLPAAERTGGFNVRHRKQPAPGTAGWIVRDDTPVRCRSAARRRWLRTGFARSC